MTNNNHSDTGYVLVVGGETPGSWRVLDYTILSKYQAVKMFRFEYADTIAGRRWCVVTPRTAKQWKAEDPFLILESRI